MKRVLFLDFDGTLGRRRGGWNGAVHETLIRYHPERNVPLGAVRGRLEYGFPWHRTDLPHLHLDTPESWWTT